MKVYVVEQFYDGEWLPSELRSPRQEKSVIDREVLDLNQRALNRVYRANLYLRVEPAPRKAGKGKRRG